MAPARIGISALRDMVSLPWLKAGLDRDRRGHWQTLRSEQGVNAHEGKRRLCQGAPG